jgi:hypothetical protein|tara:strand:+ start:642 stop:824 length:183 start_codon:yes stop_codon:yes gene_type:complete
MTNVPIYRKGIAYFPNYDAARKVRDKWAPSGRLVAYELGWTIQYWISGPYYPEHEFGSRA